MKRKVRITIMIIASLSCLAACSSNNTSKKIEGDVNNQVQEKGSEKDTETKETNGQSGTANVKTNYVYDFDGVKVEIGAEAEEILGEIGKPKSKYESPSCAFGDLDVMYTYAGVEIDTYQLDGTDYISAVILLDDSVSTPEGLTVGDDASKITELYGEPSQLENGNYIYLGQNVKLVVIVSGEKVDSIEYLNTLD